MNTLFVAPYRQNDEWGLSSRQYLKALLVNTKINLTARPYYYISNSYNKISDDIIAAENTRLDHYDVIIQKLLPHSLYVGGYNTKNIAILNVETGNWSKSRSIILLNRLDEIYVSTTTEKKWLEQSGVTVKISTVPQPIDIDYIIANQTNTITLPPQIKNTFKFYCFVDNNDRCNLSTIIRAFHLAFTETDRVSLVIKSINNMSQIGEMRNYLQNQINQIKNGLGINNTYKNELIITEPFDEINTLGLHNACDCFINLKSGNNFCPETVTAGVLGKTPIVMNNTGLSNIIDDSTGFVTKSEKTPVIMNPKPLPPEYDLFTANEFWYTPVLYSVIENMQKVVTLYKNQRQDYNKKQQNGKNNIQNYSYVNVGNQLCN